MFLGAAREALKQKLPDLDAALVSSSLADLESPGGSGPKLFKEADGPGLLVPRELGGRGADALMAVRIQLAIGSRSPSLAIATTMHHFSVAGLLEANRAGEKFAWLLLQAIAEQRLLVASGFAEGVSGQSVVRPTLQATRSGGAYLLSGAKRPCSLSRSMDILTASTMIDGELAVAIVPADSPGLSREPFWNAPVLLGAESDAVILRDVPVDDRMLVKVGPPGAAAVDHLQQAGFLWFELLITASYLGICGGLVEQVLEGNRADPGKAVSLVCPLDAAMAGIEGLAMQLAADGPSEELLLRALFCRYAAQDAIKRVAADSVELLGGIAFIRGDKYIRYFADAARCLVFHPPSRERALGPLIDAMAGAPLRIE